jgi:hypothetical protein
MSLPAPIARIEQAEADLEVTFPSGLRSRFAQENGGDIWIDGERWGLLPVWDPTTRRTVARSASNVATETAALREAYEGNFPTDAIAIANNEAGDHLLLLRDPVRAAVWRPGSPGFELIDIDWTATPRQAGNSRRSDAIRRIESVLQAAGSTVDRGVAVVVVAPGTPFYIQCAPSPDGFTGEAEGLANLPKLHVHNAGAAIVEQLEALGWTAPDEKTHGNWSRRWDRGAWIPWAVAQFTVDTFDHAYGLHPNALVPSTVEFDSA